jgi:hypothetical protein
MDYVVLASIAKKEDVRGQYLFFCWKRLFRLPDLKAWYKSFQTTQNWSLNEIELKEIFAPLAQSKKPFCNYSFFSSAIGLKKLTFFFYTRGLHVP